MKDVDPDVAALLDDLPKSKLPQPLIDEGWGRHSMDEYGRAGGRVPQKPSETQAPHYMETCCQCGRPITNARKGGGWWDHAGKTECDGALVAEQLVFEHYPQGEVDEVRVFLAEKQERLKRRLAKELYLDQKRTEEAAKRKTDRANGPCGASKYSNVHMHECSQKGHHFGFHECKYCRHLWR